MARRIIGSSVLLLATLVAAFATPARAQVRLVPQVGLWAPLSDLPSPGEAAEVGDRSATLAYGLGVELGDPSGTSFRVTALHGSDSEVPLTGFGCEDCVRSSVTTLTAAVVLRPIPNLVVLRPYLIAGGGLRRIDFDRDDLEDEGSEALFSDENDVAGHVGLGAELGLPFLDLNVELSDVISPLDGAGEDSELQHDLFLTVGIVIG